MYYRLILICLLVASTGLAQAPGLERGLTEDARLVVALDDVTRADSISTTVTRRGKTVPVTSVATSKGQDCVSIRLTLVSTKGGSVVIPWGDPRSPWTHVLIDTEGKQWREHQLQISRPGGQDPAEARKGIIPDGGSVHIWFFVSREATPQALQLAYSYSDSPTGDGPTKNQVIMIDLRQPAEGRTALPFADTGL